MVPSFLDKSLIPHSPGVYIYKNSSGKIIYVGKAIDLYHRVSSYFSGYEEDSRRANVNHIGSLDTKTALLVKQIASVETIIVESELEALILEANLIKKYLPEFNVRLTDDKDYLYIKFTKEDFPKVLTARKHELKDSLRYFGPFPSSRTVRETLKSLRKVFPWCSATNLRGFNGIQPRRLQPRACFHYHLGLCPGACVGEISKEGYRKNINRLGKLLDGKKGELTKELVKEMAKASSSQDFEEARRLKKTITGISYLTQPNRIKNYLENPNFLEDQRQIALEELQRVLSLPTIPERIEGYDISNIQGHESVGSMVVLTNGEIDKSQYRKFKIKITGKPNDYAMHQEMMGRRLKHPEWTFPDLIIIDGGAGQVSAVFPLIRDSKFMIPIYGLAKRQEWLYHPDGSIVKLPKSSGALKLLQKLRDESHRFAITFHRKLHRKTIFGV